MFSTQNYIPKKLIAVLILIFSGIFIYGQTYSIVSKTYVNTMDTSQLDYSKGIEIVNTGTANLNFTWELLLKDTLFDCEFDLCNSGICYDVLPPSGIMPTIEPGAKGWLKMHMFSGKTSGINTIKYLLKGNTTNDTLTFKVIVEIPTSIKNQNKETSRLFLYPNPAKDYALLGIKLSNPSIVDIAVYDVTGKMVYNNKSLKIAEGQNEIKINTSEFATGTYNIVVNTKNGILKEKLIVLK